MAEAPARPRPGASVPLSKPLRRTGTLRKLIASRSSQAALCGIALSCFLLAEPVPAQLGAGAFVPRDESPEDFPTGPGRDETFYACTACHGFRLVAQQRMSRQLWDDSIDSMAKRHNMPPLESNHRKIVLDYLTTTFAPRARPNPFSKMK